MLHTLSLTALLFGLLSSTAANAKPVQPLSQQELTFLCSLPPGLKAYSHVSNIPKDRAAFSAAEEQRKGISLRSLPSVIQCQAGQKKLKEGTEFFDRVGFAADGSLAVISGGYVKGPLNGQGGECYFNRNGDRWTLIGCRGTWVS